MRCGWAALIASAVIGAACNATGHPGTSVTPSPAFVAWNALPASHLIPQAPDPSPTPPVPIPAGTPECAASQLEAIAGTTSGATGHTDMPLVFRNRGSSPCFVVGYPDVAIADANGRVLAQASGTNGRGTFFDTDWVEPILLAPGTAFVPSHTNLPQGQALVHVEWWDCGGATASRIDVTVPDGGGHIIAAYAIHAGYSPGCDGGSLPKSGVLRGEFNPTGISWPPGPMYLPVSISIDAPQSVHHGSTLTYFVSIENLGTLDYRLAPCPDYFEIVGPKKGVAQFALNCSPVGAITPGRTVRFEMRLAVPPSYPPGPAQLHWALLDFRISPSSASTAITIT